MNRNHLIITVAVIAFGCIGTLEAFTHSETQEPQEIRGIVVDEHDAAWYEQQQTLWYKKAKANPRDEHAWEQCFSSARYADMLNEQYGMTTRKKSLLDEMKNHIPNSFAYNLAMYQTKRDIYGEDASPWAEKALKQIPANVGRQNTTMLISYLVMKGELSNADKATLHTLTQSLYESNAFPSYLLRYSDNCMRGMEQNALYFENGDVSFYCPLILQEALNLHTDKTVIPISFLAIPAYRNALCQSLGIKPFEEKDNYDSMDLFFHEVIEYIINKSKRPAYFSPHESMTKESNFNRKLYNEGLVFRYSTHRYDNMAIARRNVEKRYSLQYLVEPKYVNEEQWSGSERMGLNYMVMLAPVVKAYEHEGDTVRAQQLARYLNAAVMQTSLPQEEKQKYFDLLNEKQ